MCVYVCGTAEVNAIDMYGVTAVHLAAENGQVDCLKVLLDAGAACNIGTAEKRPQWVTTTGIELLSILFCYAAPHLWNKLPPSLCVPCQLATSECSPLPGSDSAPKSVVGVSHRVFHSRLKTHLSPDPFSRNLPLSLSL